jgi:hypothetical protein
VSCLSDQENAGVELTWNARLCVQFLAASNGMNSKNLDAEILVYLFYFRHVVRLDRYALSGNATSQMEQTERARSCCTTPITVSSHKPVMNLSFPSDHLIS